MKGKPEIPMPIPGRPLWAALAIPPLATVVANLLLGYAFGGDAVSAILIAVPLGIVFLIIIFLLLFLDAVGRRYHGRSLTFLGFSYFLGQIIVCVAFWFGSCLLALR
jgi:hypothetical protein